MKQLITLATLAALAAGAQAAGTVQVQFVQPEKFVDVRDQAFSRERNLQVLERHLKAAAAPYVADGQTLRIDVLDVDLAGEPKMNARVNDLRVLKGKADWPRIDLRWSLEAPGQPARSGQASVKDMSYLQRVAVGTPADEPLRYERRMLDEWFRAEFSR
jgi:Protein of unknown function (DUF3016)